jgi:hypothetical protein
MVDLTPDGPCHVPRMRQISEDNNAQRKQNGRPEGRPSEKTETITAFSVSWLRLVWVQELWVGLNRLAYLPEVHLLDTQRCMR